MRSRPDKAEPLWQPRADQIKTSNLSQFTRWLESRTGRSFEAYDDLYQFSVSNIEQFWEALWDRSELIHSQSYDTVLSKQVMPGAKWFDGARLNFAENLLRYRDDRRAIVHWREDAEPAYLTYRELYGQVAAGAKYLRELGVQSGDRVVGLLPNIPETVIAMLATTSIGAVWSSCSPDFGAEAVFDRFGQIKPKVMFTVASYQYGGKRFDNISRVTDLVARIPSLEKVVIVSCSKSKECWLDDAYVLFSDIIADPVETITFEQLPFDHPVYIMYSSGTTGAPKCIVHGAGGTLLQHYKEHVLHTNLTRDDLLFYYTTCGWMMWNWLVGSLQVGCSMFLYDGSPFHPDEKVLWRAIDQERITVFGTSPKFLSACQARQMKPVVDSDLSSLRTILSTGLPLSAANYEYVYKAVKSDLQLASISGGTDIISCFMLGNPNLPVYTEEIQCRGLGMKVEVYDDQGASVTDQVGELVCTAPFPSMPVGFWDDPDGKKYRAAYFDTYPGVWRHGDYIRVTNRGGVIVYGRSDATLNPGGVRIGTAEIYGPVEELDFVTDSIVVGQQYESDTRLLLFVVLKNGCQLTAALTDRIKTAIRNQTSPRHVPALVLQVSDIPRTINGKKVELAVSCTVNGRPVSNRQVLANPEVLEQFTRHVGLQTDATPRVESRTINPTARE